MNMRHQDKVKSRVNIQLKSRPKRSNIKKSPDVTRKVNVQKMYL